MGSSVQVMMFKACWKNVMELFKHQQHKRQQHKHQQNRLEAYIWRKEFFCSMRSAASGVLIERPTDMEAMHDRPARADGFIVTLNLYNYN